jgi:hypothetical protein
LASALPVVPALIRIDAVEIALRLRVIALAIRRHALFDALLSLLIGTQPPVAVRCTRGRGIGNSTAKAMAASAPRRKASSANSSNAGNNQ